MHQINDNMKPLLRTVITNLERSLRYFNHTIEDISAIHYQF
ncbi:hypothetical protein [Nostoc sp. PA-18-2419]|nr:hypothetical protein [Nostoc sp. PA-18-2419]